MKCAKCRKQFLFYVPSGEFKCPRCLSIIICDTKTSLKLFFMHFFILFVISLFFSKKGILALIIIGIIISIPFCYKYIRMECRVIKEGRCQENKKKEKNIWIN